MINFFKNKKIIIIICTIVIMLIVSYVNNLNNNDINLNENETLTNLTESKENSENEDKEIFVHITGEVENPGVVKLKEGSRIKDVIEAAGGLTENADISNVNLAYVVEDGIKIKIPAIEDDELSKQSIIIEESGENIILSDNNTKEKNKVININTATQTELEGLPGIGPSISIKIIEYRNKNGSFKNIDDIKNVTGIGKSKFEKIKDFIKVK